MANIEEENDTIEVNSIQSSTSIDIDSDKEEEENHSLKKGTSISSSTYLGLDKGDGINEEIPNAYSSSDKVSLKNSDSEDNEDENKSGNEDKDHVDNSYKNEYLIPLLVEDMPEEGDPACSPPYPQDIHNQPPDAPVSTQPTMLQLQSEETEFLKMNMLIKQTMQNAVLSAILCCLPIGIIAVVFALKSSKSLSKGNIHKANKLMKRSSMYTCISVAIGILVLIFWGAFYLYKILKT